MQGGSSCLLGWVFPPTEEPFSSVLGPVELGWWAEARPRGSRGPPQALSLPPALHPYPGCLDVGVEHVGDCERLAKQCQLWDLLGDLEAKCECACPGLGVRGLRQQLAGRPAP